MAHVTDRQPLSERERIILAIEGAFYRHAGSKAQRIHDELGIAQTRYYQLLNALLDNPAAAAANPLLVARLRRRRDGRA